MNAFQKKEFEKAGAYASDVLLGSFTPFSSPKTIPGRNCEMILATLNHMPYHAYHYPDKMVFVPADLGTDYEGVIIFGGTKDSFDFDILSKKDGTLELTVYRFFTIPAFLSPEIHFTKYLLRATVDEEKYQRIYSNINSEEYFFSEKKYMPFFLNNPNLYQKVVSIIRTEDSTKVLLKNISGRRESVLSVADEYQEIHPASDNLFEIVDSYDIQNIK